MRLTANTDTWIKLDDDTPPAWLPGTPYLVGDRVVNDTNRIYVCDTNGTSGTGAGPIGVNSNIGEGSTQWDYFGQVKVLTNINLENFILRIDNSSSGSTGFGSGIRIGSPADRRVRPQRIGKGSGGISARGVRIDGVYITAPGQAYSAPINTMTNVLAVSNTYGLQCNFVYGLDASNNAVRGFATGWDLYQADLPHVSYLHGTLSYRTLRHLSHPANSARPGTYYKVTVEANAGNAIEMDSGLLVEPKVENGYASVQAGEFALPSGTTWSITAGSPTITMTGAATYLQPGMPVRLDLATDRVIIIKDVLPDSATFYNATTQSYNPATITNSAGTNFKRLMGVGVVGRTSRFSMRNPSLELNTAKPNLPLAVLQPGRETLYVDATVNETGLTDATNAYAIAANNPGVLYSFGTVQCSGRFLAPMHPLAIVFGSPANGINNLRPVSTPTSGASVPRQPTTTTTKGGPSSS